jgi:hypothetical protein
MDIDELLSNAGARWRRNQGPPPGLDAAIFVTERNRNAPRLTLGSGMAAIMVIAAALFAGTLGLRQQAAPSSVGGGGPTNQACAPTKPVPPFIPPAPNDPSPPAYYDSDWFGSAALWTMLNRTGEVWNQSGLPHEAAGLSQKTFWWSSLWSSEMEPNPAIHVFGERLDAPGSFEFGPGTNAAADFGSAMLVGVSFPAPGCWQVAGAYRGAGLSYVVWITTE